MANIQTNPTPSQPIVSKPTGTTLPVQTNTEQGGNPAVPNLNGKVPDIYFGQAGLGSAAAGMIAPITMASVIPTVPNATQGAVAQDDFATLNAPASSGGKYSVITNSYSSQQFIPPAFTPATPNYGVSLGGTAAGVGQAAPTYAGGTTYAINAMVTSPASSQLVYTSLQNGNIGNTPASSPTFWRLISPTTLAQSPSGGLGYSFANPALLPLWTSAAIVQGATVGYISVNATYYVAAAYAGGTSYAQGTFVIATDNNVYVSLHAANLGNTPTTAANQGVHWDRVNSTYSGGNSYVLGQQVLQNGVLYVCQHTVTKNRPDQDATDWLATTVTANPWLIGSTYASGNIVVYNNTYYISLQGSNIGHLPGTQTGTGTGVGWWSQLFVPVWDSTATYSSPTGATGAGLTYVTYLGVLYNVIAGHTVVSNDPQVNNQLQIKDTTTGGGINNQAATILWQAVGYGVVAPYQAIAATTNNLPDANNNIVGTATWWTYGSLTQSVAVPSFEAGDQDLSRAGAGYPPLSYQDSQNPSVYDWQMGSYFGPAAVDSPTLRQDFNSTVASITIVAAGFAHTTTEVAYAVIKDNLGNLLTAGEGGVAPIVWSSSNASIFTVPAAGQDNAVLLTGVGAGTATVTAVIGSRTGTLSVTLT